MKRVKKSNTFKGGVHACKQQPPLEAVAYMHALELSPYIEEKNS